MRIKKDLITFDVFKSLDKDSVLQQNNYLIRITKNNNNLIELSINQEDYFVFGGFNKIGNSIQVKEFKLLTSNI